MTTARNYPHARVVISSHQFVPLHLTLSFPLAYAGRETGRPNVGKSTVVNRLAKRFKDGSIVFDESGVTRDRTYKRAWYCGKDFDVVDTGGLVFDDKGGDVFAKEVRVGCYGCVSGW